jgi:hypothetical protein
MTKIARSDFLQQMNNKALDVQTAKADGRMEGVNLNKADLNNDGKIQGRNEFDKLFLEMDNFDRDGSYQSMRTSVNGELTRPGQLVNAVKSTATAASIFLGRETTTTNNEGVRDAAQSLVDNYAENYGVEDAWFNIDENHALPANVRLGGLKGKWKCNLFAGNTLAKAGFEPPYYGNRGRGEYPNANQLYKWSDKHAGQFGNKTHFEMRGELNVANLEPSERRAKIEELLKTAEPGDLIIVDHMGDDVADGGHCRVVVENNLATGGKIHNAQASSNSALVREEGIGSFTGEETIWILRANRPRVD